MTTRAASRIGSVAVAAIAVVSFGCHEIHLDFSKDAASGVYDDLYSISVVDEDHAVAVGYYGATYRTSDGGTTWARGDSGTVASIYSVSMANDRVGWAVGQLGMVLRTEDGGATWVRQPNLKEGEGSHLFAVTAIDENRAVAVGAWGTRLFTQNGGASWEDDSFTITDEHPQFVWLSPGEQEKVRAGEKVYEDVTLNDVQCMKPPSTRCWLIGEFGYIFYSEDHGKTWVRSTIEGSVEVPQLNTAYNVLELEEASISILTDFAGHIAPEEHLNVAIQSVASAREIRDFGSSDDPSELFEILEARSQEARTVLEDAGILTDRLRMRGQPPWDYEDFLEDDPEFLTRYLDGRTAEEPGVRVSVLQNPYLFTIRFRNDDEGLIAGLGGVVLVTADGGQAWSYRKIDRKQALFSASAVSGRAITVGEKGLVRMSTDGGVNWSEPQPGTFPDIFTFMRDVAFDPTGKRGYIVGQTGQILRTEDAGYQWSQVLPPVVVAEDAS